MHSVLVFLNLFRGTVCFKPQNGLDKLYFKISHCSDWLYEYKHGQLILTASWKQMLRRQANFIWNRCSKGDL